MVKLEKIEKLLRYLINDPEVEKGNYKEYGMKLETLSDLFERLRLVHDGLAEPLAKRVSVIGNNSVQGSNDTCTVHLGGSRMGGRS